MTTTKLLQNWGVVYLRYDPYLAPELRGQALCGTRVEDGKTITTSRIVGKTVDNDIVTNSGSIYELGAVDPVYEEMFPNALDRFVKSLPLIV